MNSADVAGRVRHWRLSAGLSHKALAEALKVDRSAIHHWEAGRAVPSTTNLMKLAEVCGVSMQVFWSRIPEAP